ncbi:MAG: hypothetical protein HOP12_02325 [Candidatus Eisenbacteria bacterium]|uniref:Uncharacterized protein n=1 Tax=Eiseniibacteriota bacterium TaxID=2212470 RepID=A0A849SEX2_UNCEI|nr:hypothetical protein [Candidatus Eisenbacteria bacterium]
MNDDLIVYEQDRYRSLEEYHRARRAQANLAHAALDFVRERPGTSLVIGLAALYILSRRR